MSFSYLFDPNKQFQDRNGVNNVGGFLRVYIDGTDDRATTYKDFNGTLNEADIMLDTDGRAVVIVDDSLTFRIEVYERGGALQWTVTQFTARGEGGGGGSSTPVVVDGTANEIDVTESMTAGVKYYKIGLATVVKNTLLGLLASFSNLVGILNSKADKVQGATAGNIAALDASGNLTDSGSKVADFKTKQTPVADPSASGAGLEFIDSVSQNANGEITPHKKAVQDGTTAQKGVVKLSNAIDSTSVTEAATPKAVKDAYDELNNKIVARAVFLSQAEWAVQSQLQGDPAKVYYVENGTGEDAYTVYVWKESTSTYEEVDESSIDLDGYWHDSPTTTGSGNVVTNITLGNDGVPQVEKGMSAEPAFSVLPINKGGTNADDEKEAVYNLLNGQVLNDTNKPSGDSILMFRLGTPTAGNGYFLTRKVSLLWSYIKDQISSVLGLSENGYTGNATTATTASNYASGGGIDSALGGKADKVSNATNGDLAALDASGNLTDSGKKAADFAVSSVYNETDPRNLRSFIKFEGNGTQFRRKLVTTRDANNVGNSSMIKLVGCVGAWGAGDTTDFSIVVRTRGNVLFEASVFKRIGSNNAFDKVNFELYEESDGTYSLWLNSSASYTKCAISAFATGDGAYIVYDGTDGTPTGTLVASASQNYKVMMVTDGDGSNVTSTFTKASGDTSTMASGGKLSAIFTAISSFFASVASALGGKADKANITGATKCKITYNGQGIVTSGADLGASDIPNLPASKITSGTFGTSFIADDAITADKVKDDEMLPVNISGSADRLQWGGGTDNANSVGYIKLITINVSNSNTANAGIIASVSWRDSTNNIRTGEGLLVASFREYGDDTIKAKILILGNRGGAGSPPSEVMSFSLIKISENIYELWGYVGAAWTSIFATVLSVAGSTSYQARSFQSTAPTGYSAIPYAFNVYDDNTAGVGSPTTPVYVDSNGQVQPCTQGATLKSNTATLYIAGYTDNNIPYYNVKDIKNGCVNHVDFSGITNSTCDITFEAPTLSTGEEYDYIISLEGYTNNSGYSTGAYVENCKQILRYISDGNLWVGEGLFLQATDWRQICVVRGNTCEWKRVALS